MPEQDETKTVKPKRTPLWRVVFRLFLLAVVLMIAAAIVVPSLLVSSLPSNESPSIGNLKCILGAQVAFHAANNRYAASFEELTGAVPPFLDGDWSGPRSGYIFTIHSDGKGFVATASPVKPGKTGIRYFFADSTGVIRSASDGPATASSPAIGE